MTQPFPGTCTGMWDLGSFPDVTILFIYLLDEGFANLGTPSMVGLEGALRIIHFYHPRLLQALSKLALDTSRNGTDPASLDILCWGFTTHREEFLPKIPLTLPAFQVYEGLESCKIFPSDLNELGSSEGLGPNIRLSP